jgi:hypothetical protein
MPITDVQLAELKAKHGEILHVVTKYGDDVVFRVATFDEWTRFMVQLAEPGAKASAIQALVYSCAVFPERPVFDALVRARPGLLGKFGDEVAEHSGFELDAVRKK